MFFKTDLRGWATAVAQLAEQSLQIPEVRVFESSNVQNFMQNMSLSLSLSLLLTVEKTKVKEKEAGNGRAFKKNFPHEVSKFISTLKLPK